MSRPTLGRVVHVYLPNPLEHLAHDDGWMAAVVVASANEYGKFMVRTLGPRVEGFVTLEVRDEHRTGEPPIGFQRKWWRWPPRVPS